VTSGCATTKEVSAPKLTPTDKEEYAHYATVGSSVIQGQAFVTSIGTGDVFVAAGNTIKLEPITEYSKKIEDMSGSKEVDGKSVYIRVKDIDPEIESSARKTVADTEGRFRFEQIPEGSYELSVYITFKSKDPSLHRVGLGRRSHTLRKIIDVKSGEKIEIMLTKKDL
jgi:hypothetical protein